MGFAFLLSECHCGFCFYATLGFQKALPPVFKSSGFFSAGLKRTFGQNLQAWQEKVSDKQHAKGIAIYQRSIPE